MPGTVISGSLNNTAVAGIVLGVIKPELPSKTVLNTEITTAPCKPAVNTETSASTAAFYNQDYKITISFFQESIIFMLIFMPRHLYTKELYLTAKANPGRIPPPFIKPPTPLLGTGVPRGTKVGKLDGTVKAKASGAANTTAPGLSRNSRASSTVLSVTM